MAYREIEQWRQILESEEAARKSYDEACDRAAKEKQELDEKDFWECDQAEVDPKTLGLTECDNDVDVSETDNDVDEEIDFSKYGLAESDMREPLTAVSTAMGMPASTANLTSQDSVKLAEAINKLAEALAGKKAEKIDEADEAPVVPDTTTEYDDAQKADAESKAALEAAKKFYEKWLDDPDFREKNAYKDVEGATVMKPAAPGKAGSSGKVIAGTDPNSQGAKLFKSYFDKMSPEDREQFDSFARERQKTFTTKHFAPWSAKSTNKKGTLHGTGDDDENVNPLAQHGLDQTFNADNADDDMFDDPEAGDEFYSQFDANRLPSNHEGVAKHIIDVATEYGKKIGMNAKQVFDMFEKSNKLRQIKNSVRKAGQNNKPLTDRELEFIFSAFDDKELEELKKELKAEAAGNQKEQSFIDYLFRFGKERQINMKDLLKQYGISADQAGDTGAGTQQGDTLIYIIICALASYYNVMGDEADELWRVKSSQSPSKKDKELGVEPRKYSRHLACLILQELFDELHDDYMKNAPVVKIPQSSVGGPKIKAKDWSDVQKRLGALLNLIELRAGESEKNGVWNEIKSKMEQYNGNGSEKGERSARKLKTYLNDEQNEEFQKLLQKVRTDFDNMTQDEKLHVIEFDRMRLGDSQTMAQGKAQKVLDATMTAGKPEMFDKTVKQVAKSFLAGGSNNAYKDGITA